LLAIDLRKMVRRPKQQIKPCLLQIFLLTASGAQHGRQDMKVKNFSARIGVA
jgi:hypothetical protein